MSTQLEVSEPEVTNSVALPQRVHDDDATQPRRWNVWHGFWLGLFLVTLPMMVVYFARMWALPHYHYFPFAIGAVAWLSYSRSDKTIPPPANWISLLLIVGVFALMFVSLALNSPWFGAIAFVGTSAALLNVMRGPSDRSLLKLFLPLLLLIRLPLNYDGQLIIALQRVTTQLSSLLLDMLGIPHAVARNTLQLAQRELFVAEACSGIQSVFTLAFLATLLIIFFRRQIWLAPLYLCIAAALAVVGNVLRVSTVAAADVWFGIDVAEGWSHDVLGHVTLGIALLFLLSFDRLIISFFHPISSSGGSDNPVVRLWNTIFDDGQSYDVREDYLASGKSSHGVHRSASNPWLYRKLSGLDRQPVRLGIASVFSVLVLASALVTFSRNSDFINTTANEGMFLDEMFVELSDKFFEPALDDFRLTDYESARGGENPILGRNADIWRYSRTLKSGNKVTGQLVVSQAYSGWHDLCVCYAQQDWSIDFRRQIQGQGNASEAAQQTGEFEYVQLSKTGGETANLWFSGVSSEGMFVNAGKTTNEFINRLNFAFDPPPVIVGGLAMIQLWIVSDQKMEPEDSEQVAEDFDALRVLLAASIAEQHSKTEPLQ